MCWVVQVKDARSQSPEARETLGKRTVVTPTPTPVPDGCRLGQVDVNTASDTELVDIIHISIARAEELVDLRPFTTVDDLTRISGIGPARVDDIKEQDLACAGR